jgi:membrane protease YdiL (CAAX protease family)
VLTALHAGYERRPLVMASAIFALLAGVRLAGAFDSTVMVASMALTPLVLLAAPRSTWRRIGLTRVGLRHCLPGIAVTVVVYTQAAIACQVAFGADRENWIWWIPVLFTELAPGAPWLGGVVMVVSMGVVVPVAEEVCYRGVLYEAVARRTGGTAAVLVTSAGWTIVHLGDYGLNPVSGPVLAGMLPSVFLMGLALGICRLRTGSVAACIAAQGAANVLLAGWAVQL